MDHEVAHNTQAIERYLLGEMPLEERDSFEEHYFSCKDCAEEVRAGAMLTRDLKRALREGVPARTSAWAAWLKWPVLAPACAAMLLAVVVGYQNLAVLPELRAPRAIGAAVILDGQTRSGLPKVSEGAPLRFQMALDGVTASERLRVELDGAAGRTIEAGEVASPEPRQPLDVFFPGTLEPGRYAVVVRENPGGREVARSSFEIVVKESTQ
jgi:anti-sigma factor RsiW